MYIYIGAHVFEPLEGVVEPAGPREEVNHATEGALLNKEGTVNSGSATFPFPVCDLSQIAIQSHIGLL